MTETPFPEKCRRERSVVSPSDGARRGDLRHRVAGPGSYTTNVASPSSRHLALTEFVTRLRTALPRNVIDVRLFGSEARGEATAESDIDVLVVVQPESGRAALEDRAIDIAFDVNLEFGVYVSPRVITLGILNDPVWRETPFLKNVAGESVPL